MAEAVKFENIRILVDGCTISGPGLFYLLVTAGSADAVLTVTVGSSAITLAAKAGTSQDFHGRIKLGGSIAATVTLTGAGATAYAADEVGR
jgi:hypothetical protein